VQVFELLGRDGEVAAAERAYAERFAECVDAFRQRDWAAAKRGLEALRKERPIDAAADVYLELTARLMSAPPGDGWDGVIELTEK
jgi:hypothetical protein